MTSECHCNAKDVPHVHDWIVFFAHKVAVEQEYIRHHPGAAFCLMLRRHEAEGLLAELNALTDADW